MYFRPALIKEGMSEISRERKQRREKVREKEGEREGGRDEMKHWEFLLPSNCGMAEGTALTHF